MENQKVQISGAVCATEHRSVHRRLLLLFSLVGLLLIGAPAVRAGAAWKTTQAGTMYTQKASPGYVTGLKKIGSYWYYFNKNGIMQRGFVKLGGKFSYFNSKGRRVTGWLTYSTRKYRYYFDKNGIMQTGFVKVGKRIYYFNSKGVMQTGWIKRGGKLYFAASNGILVTSRWVNNYYFQADGSLATNTWIDGKWVGANGKYTAVKKGWVTSGGSTYYYNSSGKKVTGWLNVSGKTYYLNASTGAMMKGWLKVKGKYYYANSKGVIQKRTWVAKTRYVNASGAMVTGFYTIGSNTYYFDAKTGIKKTRWLTLNGKRYWLGTNGVLQRKRWLGNNMFYAGSNGALLMGLNAVGGNIYYFDTTTGAKLTNAMRTIGSDTYFFLNGTGKAARNTWVKYNSNYYYFQSTGKMAKNTWVGSYYVNANGIRQAAPTQTGWITKNGAKYYYGTNGVMYTGVKTVNGSVYYFSTAGVMQTGLHTIGGRKYYFYSDGRMAVSVTLVIGDKQYTFNAAGAATQESSISVTGNTTGTQIANFALRYVGNPYVYGGTSLTNGADCSGFVQTVFAQYGIKLLRVANDQMYGPSVSYINNYGYKQAVTVDISSIQPGDLIFYGSGNYASHVAIYIGNGQIVHASNSQPYPQGGIKISAYNYQTPIKAVRYWS